MVADNLLHKLQRKQSCETVVGTGARALVSAEGTDNDEAAMPLLENLQRSS